MKYKLTKIFTLTSVILLFLIFYCSAFNKGNGNVKRTITIAVLDFEQEGFLNNGRLNQFASDELTTSLYLKKKAKVIDRSQVTAVLAYRKISSSILSTDEIKQLGTALDADYLILGKITRYDEEIFNPENRDELSIQITFRIISTEDGSVTGIVDLKQTKNGDVKSIISDMLNKMTSSLKLE